jgi:hypothetical protein
MKLEMKLETMWEHETMLKLVALNVPVALYHPPPNPLTKQQQSNQSNVYRLFLSPQYIY